MASSTLYICLSNLLALHFNWLTSTPSALFFKPYIVALKTHIGQEHVYLTVMYSYYCNCYIIIIFLICLKCIYLPVLSSPTLDKTHADGAHPGELVDGLEALVN